MVNVPAMAATAGVTVAANVVADAISSVFDDTTNEICKCLKVVDRTLIDGFAGLGIEIERRPPPLGGCEGATRPRVDFADFVSTAGERRAREEAATGQAHPGRAACRRPGARPADVGGRAGARRTGNGHQERSPRHYRRAA